MESQGRCSYFKGRFPHVGIDGGTRQFFRGSFALLGWENAADRLEDDPLSHTWGSKRRPGLNQERSLKTQGNGIFHCLDIGGMLEGGDMMAELRVCWESWRSDSDRFPCRGPMCPALGRPLPIIRDTELAGKSTVETWNELVNRG